MASPWGSTSLRRERSVGWMTSIRCWCWTPAWRPLRISESWLSTVGKERRQYEGILTTIGEGRNSYSKTDPEGHLYAKERGPHENGQLKPGYNVQNAVNSEYITGLKAFSDRTDIRTLYPHAGHASPVAPDPLR